MINLLKLIAKLFGKNAINKTIGTRTNVIQLPNNEIKRYIKQDLNIEAASDAAAMNAKKEMEQLIPEIPKMNDAERLIFEGNLRRLDNRLNPPSAEVFEFGTKQPISKEGIASLTEKAGQKSPPGTVMGNLESRVKQLEASGKSLEEATEGKGKTLDDILGDVMQSQKTMSKMQDEGLVRAAVRYKMMDDLQKGVLKVPKNVEEVIRGASNEEDVINVFRKNYGEDALEQVDSLVPDFYKMTSPKEAVKKIETDFPNIQPKKIEFPETIDIDKLPPEEFAIGGRVGLMGGGILRGKKFLDGLRKAAKKDVYGKYKFTGNESLEDLYELERLGKITRMDMNVYDPRYVEWLDAQIIKKEKLYTPKEWENTPEVLKNKMRGRIDPDWEIANFGEDFDWDRARSTEIQQTQKLKDFDVTGRSKNAIGGRVGLMGGGILRGKKFLDGLRKAAKKGMADSKEMESLGLDVTKSSDFFKYQDMKLSGELGVEKQVQAYKDKIRDEFYGVIDDRLMKKIEVDDNPQRLAEVYGAIKEGLEMQRKGMTPEEIIRVMKQTPRTKNATGGRIGYMGGGSTGLDYLMGIDRTNYQSGGDVYQAYLKNLNDLQQKYGASSSAILYSQPNYAYQQSDGDNTEATPTTTGVPSTFQPTKMDMFSLAVNPAYGVANIASRTKTGLSLMDRAMDAMGIGRGIGGRTQGYGVDSVAGMASGPTHGVDDVNSQSVGADASAGGDAGAAAASAAGANDGPGTGGSFAIGGRVGFNEGTLDPAKQKQVKQMIKMGADVDTISTITGATPEQIQQIQQTPRTKNADGGRIGFKDGSKLPKEKTTLPINPMMDEGVDLNKRGFLKGAAGVGAGIAALGTGALRLARKGAKKAKDLDIIFSKNFDGEYIDGSPQVYTSIFSELVPHTKKAKNFLEDMVKQKKVTKNSDGSYSIHINDMPIEGDVQVFKDIRDKFDYKTLEYKQVKNKKGEWELKKEEIDNLRSYDSPLINDATYGPSYFEDDAAEYVADMLQPKTAKEIIKERADLIERRLKQKGKFANGGLSYLQGI